MKFRHFSEEEIDGLPEPGTSPPAVCQKPERNWLRTRTIVTRAGKTYAGWPSQFDDTRSHHYILFTHWPRSWQRERIYLESIENDSDSLNHGVIKLLVLGGLVLLVILAWIVWMALGWIMPGTFEFEREAPPARQEARLSTAGDQPPAKRVFLSEEKTQAVPPLPPPTTPESLPCRYEELPVLRQGDENTWVLEAQQRLGTAYYPYHPDGRFGLDTWRAIKNFQRAHGLEADGIIGTETWRQLIVLEACD